MQTHYRSNSYNKQVNIDIDIHDVSQATEKEITACPSSGDCNGKALPKLLCKILSVSFVLKTICFIAISVMIASFAYERSYTWQCTTLADVLRPVSRKTCTIFHRTFTANFSAAIMVENSSTARGKGFPMDLSQRPMSIGLVMLYDNSWSTYNKALLTRLVHNRESYCRRYGYTLITSVSEEEAQHASRLKTDHLNEGTDGSRPPAWYKLLAVLRHLSTGHYDYLLYMDMDAIIMNPEVSLEEIIRLSQPQHDFIMTTDWSGINTGIWLARNTEFTKWFLNTAWNQRQLVPKYSLDGTPHPFEYEQRAFHFLLDTPAWQRRRLPSYRGNSSALRYHFRVLPQCALNSYVMHPLELRGDREVSQYVPSDFIVHLAGKKGRAKIDLLNHFLDIAQR